MSLDFNGLKKAVRDVNAKFPNHIKGTDAGKNTLAKEFLEVVQSLTDEQCQLLAPETILLYNDMMEHPENAIDPTDAPPVTATSKEAEKARKTPPSRASGPKKARERDIYAKFQGEISNTARITMICCDQPQLTCSEVKSMLVSEGRTISNSTVEVEYATTHKVLDYLSFRGKLPEYKKTTHQGDN